VRLARGRSRLQSPVELHGLPNLDPASVISKPCPAPSRITSSRTDDIADIDVRHQKLLKASEARATTPASGPTTTTSRRIQARPDPYCIEIAELTAALSLVCAFRACLHDDATSLVTREALITISSFLGFAYQRLGKGRAVKDTRCPSHTPHPPEAHAAKRKHLAGQSSLVPALHRRRQFGRKNL